MKRRPLRLWIWWLLALMAGAVGMCSALVVRAARGRTFDSVQTVPHRRVGLLLGCVKHLAGGRHNLYFLYRIRAAADLWRAHKVDYVLVSGDNHTKGYDETTDMRAALLEAGVPEDRIYCDYAGFRTLDSVVRAREVFGLTEVTVISQAFHNERAIFLARQRGIDAVGFNARDVDARSGFRTRCRECLARVKCVADVWLLHKQPKFLGPKIIIGPEPSAPHSGG